jgi:hypothetical protein
MVRRKPKRVHGLSLSAPGKLEGAKGKGTYKGKAGSDGTMTYEVQGGYHTPPSNHRGSCESKNVKNGGVL